jgi:dTDP-4-amino-4,6-dideoxygalactose transaminase
MAPLKTHSRPKGTFIPLSRPTIDSEEIEAVVQVLRSGWLTMGPRTLEFEEAFARYIGCKHAVAVNSGTAALHLGLECAGIKPGKEVILPTMNFASACEIVEHAGARPVLIDCPPDSLNVDPEQVETYAQKNAKQVVAIVPVHMAGEPCDILRLREIAEKTGATIIEDAAHALPAQVQGRRVGTISRLTAFSFYATKNITTGDGGMITTDDEKHASRCRTLRLHGISKSSWFREDSKRSWEYEIEEPGYKYNITDVASALGLVQLQKCDQLYARRLEIVHRYNDAFSSLEEIETPRIPEGTEHAWHLYIVKLRLERLRIDRNQFIDELKERGIGAGVHFIPLHLHSYYRNKYGYKPADFPNATSLSKRIVSLPLYPSLKKDQVDKVIESVQEVLKKFGRS